MVSLELVAIILSGISISASIVYYANVLANANKTQRLQLRTNQIQSFMVLFDKFYETGLRDVLDEIIEEWSWTDFDDFMKKYGPNDNPEEWFKLRSICSEFEKMQILVKEEMLTHELIYDWIASYPTRLWDKIESVIDEYRLKYEPGIKGMYFEYFEDLAYGLRNERERDVVEFEKRLLRRREERRKIGRSMPNFTQ